MRGLMGVEQSFFFFDAHTRLVAPGRAARGINLWRLVNFFCVYTDRAKHYLNLQASSSLSRACRLDRASRIGKLTLGKS